MRLKVRSVVARAGADVALEATSPADDAADWIELLGKTVEVTVNAVQTHGRRTDAAVARAKQDEVSERIAEGVRQRLRREQREEREGRAQEEQRKKQKVKAQTSAALRAQMPDGWLTVTDFAADRGKSEVTVRRWIKKGLVKTRDVRDVPVKRFRLPSVMAIREDAEVRRNPRKKRQPTVLHEAISWGGVSGVAKAMKVKESTIRRWHKSGAPPNRYLGRLRSYVSEMLELRDERGEALEEGDPGEDTARSVPHFDR